MIEGIEKLKKLILIPISLGEIAEDSLKDGKLGLSDVLSHGPSLFALVNGLVSFDFAESVKEFKDLDDAEKAELSIFVAAQLDLQNDKVEAVIEELFGLALEVKTVVEKSIAVAKKIKMIVGG